MNAAESGDSQGALNQGFNRAPRMTTLLDQINYPDDLKKVPRNDLQRLAHELRWEVIKSVSQTGGHLGASLGVIELTVALHYVFNTPDDRIVWDVAHQAYPHKILTGRRSRMNTLRQYGGLSGFTKRAESEYDPFGAGHSSTSISAALGMATARDFSGKSNHCIAVIGDGAITGGMAYEAMNHAGSHNNRVIVILNDNEQVSLPTGTHSASGTKPSGALSEYTSRLLTSRSFMDVRSVAKQMSSFLPSEMKQMAAQFDEYARGMVTQGGTMFEELGFYYVGPIDGHNLENLIGVLENVRDMPGNKPILIHIKTEKGRGYAPAEAALDKYHGVAKFDIASGKQQSSKSSTLSYTAIFAKALIEHAAEDRKIVAITAAMPGGTGLSLFGDRFPARCFDVGIAEQHAVTFAAGMATEGYKPFCAIYSTFLQRGYDQVVHDVVLQKLPVRFILDRAGLVGNDGPTHHGTFDLAYMGCLPNIVIMAPSDERELQNMIATAAEIDDMPSVVRYPRGNGLGEEILEKYFGTARLSEPSNRGRAIPIGKGRVIKRKPNDATGPSVAIINLGARLLAAVKCSEQLQEMGVNTSVVDARFMKPLDKELILRMADTHDVMITLEEGSIGGFGSHVMHLLALEGRLDTGKLKFRPMVIPDVFIEQGSQYEQYEEAGLNQHHIVSTALRLVGREADAIQMVQSAAKVISESTIA